jgi:Barstar (barnase inhibitor)
VASLDDYGAQVLQLDGRTIVDKASLMARIPVDIDIPEGGRPRNWDALSDMFRDSLAAKPAPRTVLLWRHAEVMMMRSLNDLLMALTVFGDVARAVSSTATGFPMAMQFRLILLGEGPMFPPFDGD